MEDYRIFNFNAGPAAMPLKVLKQIQSSFLNFRGSGMSITEISHRSGLFNDVIDDAVERAKRLLKIDDRFHVLFLQGGASMQFAMIPMNFLNGDDTADYVNTGTWSTKAITEALVQKKNIRIAASSEDKAFTYIPENIRFSKNAKFVHLTSNNTIRGTQFHVFPDTGSIPIVCDMCSDIFSRPIDMEKFGMIYAGAQKNLGPSGTCMVIIRKDMLDMECENLPTMLRYSTYAEKNSMYNTPPCFGIYTIGLMLEWLEKDMGGLEQMNRYNMEKAGLLYDYIDSCPFYRTTAEKNSRSLMNITFRLPDENLERAFVAEAEKNGLGGLKGHRSVGGCRVSLYNAATMEAVRALIEFMHSFEKENRS
jgi:phosphoserine aminotransferase